MRTSNDRMVRLTAHVHAKTTKAVFISTTGDDRDAVWVPISQTSGTIPDRSNEGEIHMKEWVAEKNGLGDAPDFEVIE